MLRPNTGRAPGPRIIPGLVGAGANGPPTAAAALKPASELNESLLELAFVENSEFDAEYAGTVVHRSPALVKGTDPDNTLGTGCRAHGGAYGVYSRGSLNAFRSNLAALRRQ